MPGRHALIGSIRTANYVNFFPPRINPQNETTREVDIPITANPAKRINSNMYLFDVWGMCSYFYNGYADINLKTGEVIGLKIEYRDIK